MNNIINNNKSRTARNRRRRRNRNQRNKKQKTASNFQGSTLPNNRLQLRNMNARMNVHLSKCALAYARALVNPFGAYNELPCLPDSITVPSHRYQVKIRGVFSNGTQGVGWVAFDPWNAIVNNTGLGATYSDFPILFTGAGFTGTDYTWAVAATTLTVGVSGANSNSRFTVADFLANGWQYRLVASGLSVRYTGSSFQNQGRIILYRDQHSDNIAVGNTAATMLQDNYTVSIPCQRNTHYITAPPTEYDLLAYLPITAFINGSAATNRYVMLAYYDGGSTAAPQNFEFEAVAYYEIVGRGLPISHSDSDPVGKAAIDSSMPNRNPTVTPTKVLQSVLAKVSSVVANNTTQVFPYIASAAASAFNTYMSGKNSFPLLPSVPDPGPSIMEIDD